MNILRCIHSAAPRIGGPIANISGMQEAMNALGHRVDIATLDAPDAPYLEESTLPITALGPGSQGYGYSREWDRWMQENLDRYDAVILHGLWQYPTRSIPPLARKKSIPYFVYTHGMLDPWFNRAYPLKWMKKQLYWMLSEHRNLAGANAVLFTSEEERRRAGKSFLPYRLREAVVTYGIPAPPEPSSGLPHPAHPRPYILYLGRLHRKKGLDLLVRAYGDWAGNRDCDLVIAGPDSGPRLPVIHEIRNQPRGNIHLAGMLQGAEKWNALHNAEAFILPSHQENFGVSVVEALACGTPVLISDQVNIWREVDRANAGLVEPDTLKGTGNLLERWSRLSDSEKADMQRNARQLYDDEFEVGQAAVSLQSIIESNLSL